MILKTLSRRHPPLKEFLITTPRGQTSIDFGSREAVLALNTAILADSYNIEGWCIPDGALCPPIPSRVDYIHHMADILGSGVQAKRAGSASAMRLLDVGTGANGIYVLLAARLYGWQCVGADIASGSLANLAKILDHNEETSIAYKPAFADR